MALSEKIANIAQETIEKNRKKNQDKEKEVNAMPEFTHKQEPKNTTFQPLVLTNDMLQKQTGNKKLKFKLKRKINIDDKMNELAPWARRATAQQKYIEIEEQEMLKKFLEELNSSEHLDKFSKRNEQNAMLNIANKIRRKEQENLENFEPLPKNVKQVLHEKSIANFEAKQKDIQAALKTKEKQKSATEKLLVAEQKGEEEKQNENKIMTKKVLDLIKNINEEKKQEFARFVQQNRRFKFNSESVYEKIRRSIKNKQPKLFLKTTKKQVENENIEKKDSVLSASLQKQKSFVSKDGEESSTSLNSSFGDRNNKKDINAVLPKIDLKEHTKCNKDKSEIAVN